MPMSLPRGATRTISLSDVLARADSTPEQALKPVFDLLWQVAGFARSERYNVDGSRIL